MSPRANPRVLVCLGLFAFAGCGGGSDAGGGGGDHGGGDGRVDAGGDGSDGGDEAAGDDAGADGGDGASGDGGTRADAGDGTPSSVWYEPREPIELAVSGSFGDAFRAAHAGEPDGIIPPDRKKEPFEGSFVYPGPLAAETTSEVVLTVRGNSSLQECAFPKLKLGFGAIPDDERDPFVGTKKIKIGTHCGEEDTVNGNIGRLRNEVATWREAVVYELARTLGITTLETRPAIIEYTDTSAEPAFTSPLRRKAFLLEHIDELAKRLDATALVDPLSCGDGAPIEVDAKAVLRIKLFHAMIGNWDWAIEATDTSPCGHVWNTEVLTHADGSVTLVPADFDLAAFVIGMVRNPETNQLEVITADNAKASARHYLDTFTQGEASDAVAVAKTELLAKKATLLSVVDEAPMDDDGRRLGKLLLGGFFAVLSE